jgi:hypothetical protein
MGFGNYSREAHVALTRARASVPKQELFTQSACHPLMSPKGVRARESRDSAEHPASLPIAFALDVTGSMGHIPDQIARTELPGFMKVLTDCGVADPQLLFAAVGDATNDKAPLQVGQFESTAKQMDQWLTWSFLEGGGGGGDCESYELALYFFAQHTEADSWVKRKHKGYLFLTGDELPYPAVSRAQVDTLLGDRLDEDIPTEDVIAALCRTFRPFFIIPDPKRRNRCERRWRDLLGDHVICLNDASETCYAAAGLVALGEGVVKDVAALAGVLSAAGAPKGVASSVVRALEAFAATLGKDGVPGPVAHRGGLSPVVGPSGLVRPKS